MRTRLFAAILLASLAVGSTGCQTRLSNLFSDCDQRPSLADWFDCYGPTGCYCRDGSCRHGGCREGGCSQCGCAIE
jgi:hypothetical protein